MSGFKRDTQAISAFLSSGALAPALLKEAEQLRAAAAAAAPRGSTDRAGRLADSYKAETTKAPLRPGGPVRDIGRVYNDARHALAVEFGHRSRAGNPVPGAHTLGKLIGSKGKRKRRK
nr:MAG TPA: putative tail-component [Caudoviricetes sp.]